jgi:HK97 family phage prohead protease
MTTSLDPRAVADQVRAVLARASRSAPAELKVPDHTRAVSEYSVSGNLVEALIVPWDTPAPISELALDDEGGLVIVDYREQFARGSFRTTAEKVPHRVSLVWSHEETWANIIGRGIEFIDSAEGEIGKFRLVGDTAKARDMLGGQGMSVSFQSLDPIPGTEKAGELVVRRRAHLRHVAATPTPAYDDARVLAIREADAARAAAAAERAANDALLATAMQLRLDCGLELSADHAAWLTSYRASLSAK